MISDLRLTCLLDFPGGRGGAWGELTSSRTVFSLSLRLRLRLDPIGAREKRGAVTSTAQLFSPDVFEIL